MFTGMAPQLNPQASRSTHAPRAGASNLLTGPGSTTAMSHRGGPDHGDVTSPWTGAGPAGAVMPEVAGGVANGGMRGLGRRAVGAPPAGYLIRNRGRHRAQAVAPAPP